jgi:hypothetical protein
VELLLIVVLLVGLPLAEIDWVRASRASARSTASAIGQSPRRTTPLATPTTAWASTSIGA